MISTARPRPKTRPKPRPAGTLSFYLRNGAVVGIIKLASVPLVLSISVLLARWLGPQEYGVYAIAWSLAAIGAAAASGGVSQFLTRRVAELHKSGRQPEIRPHIAAAMLLVSLAALVFLLLLAAGWSARALPLPLTGSTVALIFLVAAFIGVINIGSAALRGLERAAEGQLCLLILAPAASAAALLLMISLTGSRTAWAALAAMAAGYGLGAVLSQWRLRRLTAGFRGTADTARAPALVRPVAAQSKTYIAYAVLMILGLQLNLLMVGVLLQEEHVSYYNLADKAAQFAALPVGILELLMATRVVSLYSQGNFDGLRKLYLTLTLAGFAAALLIAAPLYVFGEEIIRLLLGQTYAGGIYPVMLLLLAAQLVRAAFGPVTVMLLMTGHQAYCVASQLTGAAVLATATWLLVPHYGLQGAGMAATAGVLAAYLPLAAGGYRTLGLRLPLL
ncbi:lipopolysaccharide biosynthesis protein [Leisingera sp. MMG026]|uniref:lipopolysaccharide biosynthesis protein n=1 Tax=Leisingera sp. MMG026 TaxID=2909982 RepID=UPI001F37B2B5|nr:lipopolysaccharide biosynthesis protein [Leisingera sp. MMG026]MCF6431199.1 lipopolysaccharide biosynthesis protein [Leisingera sp. MMG026]